MKKFFKNFLSFFFLLDTWRDVVIIIVLVFAIRTFVISPYRISGPSMCDTLNAYNNGACNHGEGEYIIVSKFMYFFREPERSDVIVFVNPNGHGESFIKRVIGLPGETVVLRGGFVYIENEAYPKLDESAYLNEKNLGYTKAFSLETRFEVPAESYFVMGDNRVESLDSRAHFSSTFNIDGKATAFVPKESISGMAWIILWPFSEIKLIGEK